MNHSKIFGEISNQAYYGHLSDLLFSLFSQRKISYPVYIRLNIAIDSNKNPYFETLNNITYPDLRGFQNKKDFKDIRDTFKAGLKIEIDKRKRMSIGYYDNEFDGVLCLSSNNLTSTGNYSCMDEEIINICSATYLVNNTNVTQSFDCYELGKLKISIYLFMKHNILNILYLSKRKNKLR